MWRTAGWPHRLTHEESYAATRDWAHKILPGDQRALAKRESWLKAVDGVSVQVAEGETLGIVGESGSGKTTLAKLFLLLERPTAGALRFDGQDLLALGRADLARYRRAVQAVFQDPYSSLNPRMRVADIVAEPLPPGRRPESYCGARARGGGVVPGGTQQRQRQPLPP